MSNVVDCIEFFGYCPMCIVPNGSDKLIKLFSYLYFFFFLTFSESINYGSISSSFVNHGG